MDLWNDLPWADLIALSNADTCEMHIILCANGVNFVLLITLIKLLFNVVNFSVSTLQRYGKAFSISKFIFNYFHFLSVYAGFKGCIFFEIDGKSMFEHTLSRCQNLAMCSHDVRNVLMMSVMRALCVLCVGYAGATRAMRVRHTGYVGRTCTLWAGRGHRVGQPYENAKKSVVRAGICTPPMRVGTTFLRA